MWGGRRRKLCHSGESSLLPIFDKRAGWPDHYYETICEVLVMMYPEKSKWPTFGHYYTNIDII